MPEIVFDSCSISNFALAGAFGIVTDLYGGRAYITEFVAAEILRGIQAGHARLGAVTEAVRAGRIKRTGLRPGKETRLFESLSLSLGLGEASSIAAAKMRGLHFASDDRVARAEAARSGVLVTGTLGILAAAVRDGVCDLKSADRHLAKMIEAGFFSPVRTIRGVS